MNQRWVAHPTFGWVPQAQDGAFVSVFGQRGVSPLQVDVLRPVSESHCVVVRRGGKQLEENDQSVTFVNSIRPGCLASLPSYGEAQTDESRKPMTLRGSVVKRSWEQSGGWRWNGQKGQTHEAKRPVERRTRLGRSQRSRSSVETG